jgi:hypothetical protein
VRRRIFTPRTELFNIVAQVGCDAQFEVSKLLTAKYAKDAKKIAKTVELKFARAGFFVNFATFAVKSFFVRGG